MNLEISTLLGASLERVWGELQTPRLLQYVAWPLVRFRPIAPTTFPATWTDAEYLVEMRLFGVLPAGRQKIRISRRVEGAVRILRDDGSGQLAKMWDHVIRVEPVSDTTTRYFDTLEVRAGALTPLVWMFAQVFYRHRQRRWRALIRGAFDYGTA